jgi:hypothetical protein
LFLGLVLLSVTFSFLWAKARYSAPLVDGSAWLLIAALVAFLGFATAAAIVTSSEPINLVRIVAFAQFVVAVLWGYFHPDLLARIDLRKVLWIYVVFTVVFVVTNGAVESVLIRSRALGHFARLTGTGRGVSTLSPEPSFFALQIFNLYLVRWMVLQRAERSRHRTQVFLLSSACWMASLSGYGLFILVVSTFVSATLLFAVGGGILIGLVPRLALFESVTRTRAVSLLLSIIEDRGIFSVLTDVSFSIRLSSFRQYIDVIQEHTIFGDGFSFAGGGGFISVIAGLGFTGILFLLPFVLIVLLAPGFGWRLRIALVFWFAVNTISGSIGVPSIGVVLGLIAWRGTIGLDALVSGQRSRMLAFR